MFNALGNIIRSFDEIFGTPIYSYCRLATVDEDCLIADDGSYISLIQVEGGLKHISLTEYESVVQGFTEKIQSALSEKGHCIQVVFEYDPESSSTLDKLFEPSKVTAKNLGLNMEDLLTSWCNNLKKYCAKESLDFVLWTRPEILPDTLRKLALAERNKKALCVPQLEYFQKVNQGIEAIKDIHLGFVTGILDTLKSLDLLVFPIHGKEALKLIRSFIDPAFTSENWTAHVSGDPFSLCEPDPDSHKSRILENVFYSDLKSQLFSREGEMLTSTTMKIGDRLYSPLMMTSMPQNPKPFQEFFRVITKKKERMPYRISFLLEHGNINGGLRTILASILAFTSSENKKLNNAIEALRCLELEGMCCVHFQICLCTWVDLLHIPLEEAQNLIKRRTSELAKAVQGWGTSDVSELIGDPLYGISATIPALMPTSPSPQTIAPLQDAISMLPFRVASPWKEGSLIFRTQDGKIIPFQANSSEQTAWIDLGAAPMGGGKSVFLNAFNFAFIFQGGLSRWPWVSIIDIGPSSSGLITLIKESLPPHKQYLATYQRLRMTADYAINPFDLPLGNRMPLPSHLAFLVNFLSLLATPLNENAPADGVAGLLRRAIVLAYEELGGSNGKLYQKNILIEIDELLLKLEMPLDFSTTWWEVVDFLFTHNFIHEATMAQRYAVPLLSDVVTQINQNVGIQNTYDSTIRTQVWRSLIDAIEAYIVF